MHITIHRRFPMQSVLIYKYIEREFINFASNKFDLLHATSAHFKLNITIIMFYWI